MDKSESLGAYLAYYWPVSYAQATYVLRDLERRGFTLPGGRAADIGSGPGPVACALADAGFDDIVACDSSARSLEAARRLAEGRFRLETRRRDAAALPEDGRFGCIAFGHVLNELYSGTETAAEKRAALIERAAGLLERGGFVLILEPALLATSRELLVLRDILVGRGYPVRSPCVRRGACPALGSPEGTCHAEVRWKQPEHVRRLAKAARLNKDTLKMSYLVIGRKDDPPSGVQCDPPSGVQCDRRTAEGETSGGRTYRVVSDPLVNKAGKVRYMICGEDGRFNLMAGKGSGFPAGEAFFSLRRGDLIRLSGSTERRETGESLTADTELSLE